MRIVETDYWALPLAEEWLVENEEETVILYDEDGVSTLEITALKPEDASISLADAAMQIWDQQGEKISLAKQPAFYVTGEDEELAFREWVLEGCGVIILVSHSCDVSQKGLDDKAVNELLEGLVIAEELEE